jgi:hypothetical protein
MSLTKKSVLAAILVAAAVFASVAAADHGGRGEHRDGHHTLLQQRLVGSILSDPPIHGVARGGVPWEGTGTATLERRGRFEFRIRNLVIQGTGNAGPVTTIKVSLFCAPDASGPAFTTGSEPLSHDGDAEFKQHATVPARCLAPVVLVHPNGNPAAYIAATGFTS